MLTERQQVVLRHSAPDVRDKLALIFALDNRLASLLQQSREPLIAQLRLTWWRDALLALDEGAAPAEPLLQRIHAVLVPGGIRGADLASIADGWILVLAEDFAEPGVLGDYAAGRGGALFSAAASAVGGLPGDALTLAGRGWAMADLAEHIGDRVAAERIKVQARSLLEEAFASKWCRPLRSIGLLALLALLDLIDAPPSVKLLRTLRFTLFGR